MIHWIQDWCRTRRDFPGAIDVRAPRIPSGDWVLVLVTLWPLNVELDSCFSGFISSDSKKKIIDVNCLMLFVYLVNFNFLRENAQILPASWLVLRYSPLPDLATNSPLEKPLIDQTPQ